MKVKGKLIKLSLLIGFFLLISAFLIGIFSVRNLPSEKESRGVFSLTKPVFAQADITFLEEEAGISAYTKVGQEVNLTKAKTAFKTIEKKTNEYVIGSVGLRDFGEAYDVHIYVHKSGWIVAYYLKEEPIAKIINWNNLDVTKLEEGLGEICDAAGLPFIKATYYDFRYPNAEKLMFIIDEDSFKLRIPSSFIVYERSRGTYGQAYLRFYIDGNMVQKHYGEHDYEEYKTISPTQLKPGVFHKIKVKNGVGGIVLAYKER